MNYAAFVKAKLDDPNTPREQYMRYWHEWQDILRQQGHLNYMAEQRRNNPYHYSANDEK